MSTSTSSPSSPSPPQSIILPHFNIQSDWELSFLTSSLSCPSSSLTSSSSTPSPSSSTFWISSSLYDEKEGESHLSEAKFTVKSANEIISSSSDFHIHLPIPSSSSCSSSPSPSENSLSISVSYTAPLSSPVPSLRSTSIISPFLRFPSHSSTVYTADISPLPSSPLAISGSRNGEILIWNYLTGEVKVSCDISTEIGDISHVKFFPSSELFLSVSSDYQYKIRRVDNGNLLTVFPLSARHSRPITNIQMVDRGRMFISSSLDGDIRVYDTGSQKCSRVRKYECPIQSFHAVSKSRSGEGEGISVWDDSLSFTVSDGAVKSSALYDNFLSSSCVMVLAHSNGKITLTDFKEKDSVSTSHIISENSTPITTCKFLWNKLKGKGDEPSSSSSFPPFVICGDESGKIHLFDTKKGKVVLVMRRDDANITNLHVVNNKIYDNNENENGNIFPVSVLVSTSLGSLFTLSIDCTSGPSVSASTSSLPPSSSAFTCEILSEYSGVDCESVSSVSVSNGFLLSSSHKLVSVYRL